jgi:uncharacterized membrane protein
VKAVLRRVIRFDAHHRLFVAVAVGALAFCASFRFLRLPVSIIAAWDSFAFSSIVLAWSRMIFANAKTSVRAAKLQDSSRTAIFLFVIIAALASIFAVAVLLLSERGLSGASLAKHVLLAALTGGFFLDSRPHTLRPPLCSSVLPPLRQCAGASGR